MIQYNQSLKEQFQRFYERKDSFSIGICNGCQLMTKLGWIDGDLIEWNVKGPGLLLNRLNEPFEVEINEE